MRCPECVELDWRSVVYPGPSARTAMYLHEYYDPDGNHHWHDPNTTGTSFRCSEGHEWHEVTQTPCPSCEYGR